MECNKLHSSQKGKSGFHVGHISPGRQPHILFKKSREGKTQRRELGKFQ